MDYFFKLLHVTPKGTENEMMHVLVLRAPVLSKNNKQYSTKKKILSILDSLAHWWEIASFQIAEEKIKLPRIVKQS